MNWNIFVIPKREPIYNCNDVLNLVYTKNPNNTSLKNGLRPAQIHAKKFQIYAQTHTIPKRANQTREVRELES